MFTIQHNQGASMRNNTVHNSDRWQTQFTFTNVEVHPDHNQHSINSQQNQTPFVSLEITGLPMAVQAGYENPMHLHENPVRTKNAYDWSYRSPGYPGYPAFHIGNDITSKIPVAALPKRQWTRTCARQARQGHHVSNPRGQLTACGRVKP